MTTPPNAPRPEPVATADLVAQLRAEVAWDTASEDGTTTLILAAATALEDTAAERDRAHATLREIATWVWIDSEGNESDEELNAPARLARDRLENP
jgi:hypothetical protein